VGGGVLPPGEGRESAPLKHSPEVREEDREAGTVRFPGEQRRKLAPREPIELKAVFVRRRRRLVSKSLRGIEACAVR
jgi:hypothetical protein